jgi:hypothetical protein
LRAPLCKNHPLRDLKSEEHILMHCFFTPAELQRLKKIKSKPSWIPREARMGARDASYAPGRNKKNDAFYKKLLKEFEQILSRGGEDD